MHALLLFLLLLALPAAAQQSPASLHIFNWNDYIDRSVLGDFEKQSGIKVVYDEYDDNSILNARLQRGTTGYDLVVPTAMPWLAQQISAGFYQKLDKDKIPNLQNLDPQLMRAVQKADPENAHSVIYQWGTNGILYNADMVRSIFPDAPTDSWDMVFKPENIARLKSCGVAFLDSPTEIYPIVLNYLGRNPASGEMADLVAAEKLMKSIRPSIKYFHSSRYIDDLAQGRVCAVVGYSGDFVQARARAQAMGSRQNITYSIPREGTLIWFDMLAIPADAPNPDAAHAFINYLLQPEVMAKISNYIGYANAVPAALPLMKGEIKGNPMIYPSVGMKQRLFSNAVTGPAFDRAMNQSWARMRSSNEVSSESPKKAAVP
ncbi:MAG: polyamine ABC transporter substrate-binding protein [Bdellovibrionales bacterium]